MTDRSFPMQTIGTTGTRLSFIMKGQVTGAIYRTSSMLYHYLCPSYPFTGLAIERIPSHAPCYRPTVNFYKECAQLHINSGCDKYRMLHKTAQYTQARPYLLTEVLLTVGPPKTYQLLSRVNLPAHRLPCTSPVAAGPSVKPS